MPGVDVIHTLLMRFALQLFHEPFGDAIHAADGRHHPDLITHTDVAVLTNITLKGAVLFLNAKFLVYRIVCVFECAGQIGLQVVLVHPVAGLQILTGVTDGIAIFDDVFSLFHVLDQYLVTCWCVLFDGNLLTVHLDNLSFFLRLQTDHYAICRINL